MFSYSTPKGKRTGFQCDIDTIRRYLCDIGNSWLLIAYRVYEMSVNEDFRSAGYKSIVEACEKELGFKTSPRPTARTKTVRSHIISLRPTVSIHTVSLWRCCRSELPNAPRSSRKLRSPRSACLRSRMKRTSPMFPGLP